MIEVYFFRIDTAVIDCSIILLFSKMMTWDGIIETSTRVGSHWTDKEGLSGFVPKKEKRQRTTTTCTPVVIPVDVTVSSTVSVPPRGADVYV